MQVQAINACVVRGHKRFEALSLGPIYIIIVLVGPISHTPNPHDLERARGAKVIN